MNHILENLDYLTGSGNKNVRKTLEKLTGAIKNENSRDIDNIGYTRHRTRTNKPKNITQHMNLK
jgi:hypothetical protein